MYISDYRSVGHACSVLSHQRTALKVYWQLYMWTYVKSVWNKLFVTPIRMQMSCFEIGGGLYAKPALSGNQDVLIFSENHTQFILTYTAIWIVRAFVEPLWAIWRTTTLHSRVENTPKSNHLILNGKNMKRWAIFINYLSVYMEEMCCQGCIKIVEQLTKHSWGLHWMTWKSW